MAAHVDRGDGRASRPRAVRRVVLMDTDNTVRARRGVAMVYDSRPAHVDAHSPGFICRSEVSMSRFVSPRVFVALGLLAVLGAGAGLSAQRGSNAMAAAATRFLEALTPEQRKQAVF